ncbi:MAG: RNA methyltransferase [Saprospiraceae bacterium]|nr:RNA methyltransferase [Saprospiraceae bacterium]
MRKLKTSELERISIEEFRSMPKLPLVVVLDNLRSGLNVGSIFRTADAFGIAHIYLCGITVAPPHREILKSAIGATESVVWSTFASTAVCLNHLKSDGWRIVGVEQTSKSKSLTNFRPGKEEKLALVFGNEVEGLSEEILPVTDECIEVPQIGTKHSLNVSVCAGIVLWHCFEKLSSDNQRDQKTV